MGKRVRKPKGTLRTKNKGPASVLPLDDVPVELDLAVASGKAFLEGVRHYRAYDEQEQGHDQVFEAKALPFYMSQLCTYPCCSGVVEYIVQASKDSLAADDPEHVETAQRID